MAVGAETTTSDGDFGAIVVGAGFGGIQMVYELRQLGVSVRLIEEAPDVGGTWYWNRYPGARTDSESWVYCFSFSKELEQEWNWQERYPSQPEVLAYLRYATDRFDLRRHMQFHTRVEAASYDETSTRWVVTTNRGETFTSKFLIPATGPLSRPLDPPFEGLDSFEGEWYQTARWPNEDVDFSGKRVGVIGTGATGIQVVPIVAEQAAQVTVFQRTPNYVLPAGNRPLTDEERQDIKGRYDEIWALTKKNAGGQAHEPPTTSMKDFTPEQVRELLEQGWQKGGFQILSSFSDIMLDEASNEVFCEFIRSKVRDVVEDPETAELLCPKGYPFGAKRPPLGHDYYEAFNRDNVTLVDVTDNPIERITPKGLRTLTDEYDFDILVFAVGFDASTGALLAIDIRGRDGQRLSDRWATGPRTYLGICVDGFPNMFMVAGPQSPFANIPPVIDGCARWISRAVRHVIEDDLACLDPTPEAVERWCSEADMMLNASPVFTKGDNYRSFFLGTNVPGKPRAAYFYFGGVPMYLQHLDAEADNGFEGFSTAVLEHSPVVSETSGKAGG